MNWSLKYTWPIYAFIVLFIGIRLLAPLGISSDLVNSSSSILVSIGAIYYLYHSPFGATHFLPLACLLILRFMIPITTPFTQTTGISLYMGINAAVLFFYCLRTLNKSPIRKADYRKLFMVGGVILTYIISYGVLLYLKYYIEDETLKSIYIKAYGILTVVSLALIFGLVIMHLIQLKQYENDMLDHENQLKIDEIGKEISTESEPPE